MLLQNDLIKYETPDGSMLRILGISRDGTNAWVFSTGDTNALPRIVKIAKLKADLETGCATLVKPDPYLIALVNEDALTEKAKKIRARAAEIIAYLLESAPDIYFPDTRARLIRECYAKFGARHKIIYLYLRRYWTRGQTANALLPDYDNCGGRGNERAFNPEVKRGRPRNFPIEQECNVGFAMRQVFRVCVDRYLIVNHKFSMRGAFDQMIKEFFLERGSDPNTGLASFQLKPEEEDAGIPSFAQFQYWIEKDNNKYYVKRQRLGATAYDKDHRGLLGTSNAEVWGPGARFQIDATIADVYLVSRLDRKKIIGRPVLYLVIDVHTRMIVGVYVGLEGPSWVGAMMAIANTASNKQAFCARFGRMIEPHEWPCHYLPLVFLGDRGEMEATKIEVLARSFNVWIENSAPYRADWKGIVEQRFKLLPAKFKPYVSGYIQPDYRARGGRDYRLDATLDVDQFTQIIIECILYYNNQHVLKNYDKDKVLAAFDFPLTPANLWEWGIANTSGKLREFPEDSVRFSLMPEEDASVTSFGIQFKGAYYTCPTAVREHWFDRARQSRRWSIKVSYDPRDLDVIYLCRSLEKLQVERCTLTDRSRAYEHLSAQEILQQQYEAQRMHAENERPHQIANANLSDNISAIVNKASAMQGEDTKESAASRTKNIRANRADEKAEIRSDEVFRFDTPPPTLGVGAKVIPFPPNEEDDLSEPDITQILSTSEKPDEQ